MNKRLLIIIGAVVLLVILIVINVFLSRSEDEKNKNGQDITAPGGRSEGRLQRIPLTDAQKKEIIQGQNQNRFNLSDEQKARLKSFNSKLPLTTADLEIGYSPLLNQYFFKSKTDRADQELRRILEENGLLDLVAANPTLFIPVEDYFAPDIYEQDMAAIIEFAEEHDLKGFDPEDEVEEFAETQEEAEKDLTPEQKKAKELAEAKKLKEMQEQEDKLNAFRSFVGAIRDIDLGGGQLKNILNAPTPTPTPEPTDLAQGGGVSPGSGTIGGNAQLGDIIYPPNLGPGKKVGNSYYYQMPLPKNNEYGFHNVSCRGHHWGNRVMIGVLYTVAVRWKELNPNSRLIIWDITAGTGHQSHKNGIDVDVTTSDLSGGDIRGGVAKNVQLGKLFIDTGALELIYFGDIPEPPVAVATKAELDKYAASKGIPYRTSIIENHSGHFHVRLLPKYRLDTYLPGC